MNFILEFIPKKENEKVLVVVVRSSNGFPLAVCDSLDDAKNIIETKVNDALANVPQK